MVGALVLPVVALAGIMVFQSYRNERDAIARGLLGTTRAVAALVDTKVDETAAILRVIATSEALAHGDFASVDSAARQALVTDARWFSLSDPAGAQWVNTRVPRGTGLPRMTKPPELLPALRQGETYVSNLRQSATTGEFVVQVSRPYLQDGAVKYVLTISIPPQAWGWTLDVNSYAPGKIMSLLDREGIVIARNRSPERFIGQPATSDLKKAMTQMSEGILDNQSLEGIQMVSAFSRTQAGWSMAMGVPKTELYESARRLLVSGLLGSVLLILVAILMAAWIGRALVRSTDRLAAAAESLGRGELPDPAPSGLNELDFVGRTMRRTAAMLLRRTRMLEVLNRINGNLVASHDISAVVRNVVDAGRELSGATAATFLPAENITLGEHSLHGESVTALLKAVGESNRALRIQDLNAAPPALQTAVSPLKAGTRSLLGVHVKSRKDEVFGALVFMHPAPEVFGQEAEDIVVGLAAEAAIAIENARLYDALAHELAAKSRTEAELREVQQRLHEHARELEQKVEERTASLREAVTQMEEFSYTVSHDLRSPLRAMYGYADALIEDYGPKLDDTAREYLRRIQRASRRMDALTTDLLTYSRVARAEVKLEPVHLEPIVHGIIEHYPELQPGSADLVLKTPFLPVQGHAPSLTQCLANLLANAAKFVRPSERPAITLGTESRNDRVRIWIEDRGIGIDPRYQAKLFRIFERVPNKAPYEGTGIGLAIVRKAADKMGGTCGVDSDGTHGSRFWIELAAA